MIQHLRFLPAIFAVLLVLTGGCGTTRTRQGPYVEIPAGNFARAWTADLGLSGGDRVVGLTAVGDLIIAQTGNNVAFALSADGGTLKWSTQVMPRDRAVGRPVLSGERIVFPAVDRLIVFSKEGRREKEVELDRAVRSGLAPAGEFVYVGFDYVGQGRLGRVSLESPYAPVRWELLTRGAVNAAPAVFQDGIFAGSQDGNVYAVSDGRTPLWALPGNVFSTGGPIEADLRADDTGVYVASTDSKLYALDRQTGKIKWQFFAGQPLRTPPMVTDDSVYQFVPGRGVVALEKLSGAYNREPKWTAERGVQPLAQDAQRVYLRGSDNNVFAVDRRTGQTVFATRRNDLRVFSGGSSPTGDMVYAGTQGGQIIGIKPVTSGGTTGQLVSNDVATPQIGG